MKLLKRFKLTQMLNNAYLINVDDKNILIDAPGDIQKVINYLKENDMDLDEVWLTHYHVDHILGLNELFDIFPNLKIYISKEEIEGLYNKDYNLSEEIGVNFNYNGEVFNNSVLIDKYPQLEIFYISGHSLNSSCYFFKDEKVLFSGDVLFRGTIGRSDLIFGDQQKLIKGIKDHLFTLDDETEVYAGHGFKTTIKEEKENNIISKNG